LLEALELLLRVLEEQLELGDEDLESLVPRRPPQRLRGRAALGELLDRAEVEDLVDLQQQSLERDAHHRSAAHVADRADAALAAIRLVAVETDGHVGQMFSDVQRRLASGPFERDAVL